MFFESAFLDESREEISIEIDLPDTDQPLVLVGQVRWVDDGGVHSGMGIRFTNVAPHERLRLANFVLQRTYQAH
jgi:hypothetical protein